MVTFEGRTSQCYYIVTGTYGGSGGSGPPPQWNSEFDTNFSTPHFVVTINDRDSSNDDQFCQGYPSLIRVELVDYLNQTGGYGWFTLSQKPTYQGGTGSVIFVDANGNPIQLDTNGNTAPFMVTTSSPNVDVYAEGADLGDVEITAQQASGQ